ncbi:hypothetical protein BS17DRAFT_469720 [Gyrodon lividus]|nr:hypothetical protein BS17DRAFT_469720 [Gyrodon lividus]
MACISVENGHPLFMYAKGHWKLDCLAHNSYSAWHIHHLDKEGNWKKRRISMKTEGEDEVTAKRK